MKKILGSSRHRNIKIVGIILIVVAAIVIVAVMVGRGDGPGPGPGPSVEVEIRDWYALDAIRNNLGDNYLLMNDSIPPPPVIQRWRARQPIRERAGSRLELGLFHHLLVVSTVRDMR